MESANASNAHTLEIEGMRGDSCVSKVTDTLRGVQGVTARHVKVGSATINSDPKACAAACAALGSAGYKARESTKAGNAEDQRDSGRNDAGGRQGARGEETSAPGGRSPNPSQANNPSPEGAVSPATGKPPTTRPY